jgi:uncharacterized protein (DUF2147 family)
MKTISLGLLISLFVSPLMASAEPTNPEGMWVMTNGKLTVKVAFCGGQNLCGNIVALQRGLNKDGTPRLDKKNPNAALRARQLIGLQVFNGLAPTGENQWKGTIYNADDGGTYRAYASLNGDKMEVKGCWGPFCKDLNFKKVK